MGVDAWGGKEQNGVQNTQLFDVSPDLSIFLEYLEQFSNNFLAAD